MDRADEIDSADETNGARGRPLSRSSAVAYVALVALLCLVPSVGLLFGGGEVSSDSDAAPAPKLFEDDGNFNFNVMSDAGDWFDDHFAFRNEWVTAAAALEGGLFGVSTNESVVYGSDGWLYYGDSVDDFRGTDQLNDRQLYDIAHSMKLVQTYALGQGVDFTFMVSPNKNTLYGQGMPYYYQVRAGDASLDRLPGFLEAEGVNYVDASDLLRSASDGAVDEDQVSGEWNENSAPALTDGEVLYHKRDSHWNNKGAALVADALLSALGHDHKDYSHVAYDVRDDFAGDLDKMLFPSAPTLEEELYYDGGQRFRYVTENVESNFDPKIETASTVDGATGSLVMYRDSFGNSLLPFMAEAYGSAYFSRAVPYQLSIDLTAHEADALVIERAQRFMRDMAANPPIMPAPMLLDDQLERLGIAEAQYSGLADADGLGGEAAGKRDGASFTRIEDIEELVQGDYMRVTGSVPAEDLAYDARIAVRVNGKLTYEAFGASDAETGAERFQLLIPKTVLQEDGNTYELLIW